MRSAYLRGANFVKCNKGKCLSHHGRRKVALGDGDRDENTRQKELREKSERLDTECRCSAGRYGGCEIQQDVIRREVVTVINSRNVMEVSMLKERCVVAMSWSVTSDVELFA
jgi:hypothetical protein